MIISNVFGMLGKVLWQVKPDGQTPPIRENLQLSLVSKASPEEGVDVAHTPITKGQSQEQGEEEWEEALANDHDEAGQNTQALPGHTAVDITSGVAP